MLSAQATRAVGSQVAECQSRRRRDASGVGRDVRQPGAAVALGRPTAVSPSIMTPRAAVSSVAFSVVFIVGTPGRDPFTLDMGVRGQEVTVRG